MKKLISLLLLFALIAALVAPFSTISFPDDNTENPFSSFDKQWLFNTNSSNRSSNNSYYDSNSTLNKSEASLYNIIVKFCDDANLNDVFDCVSNFDYKQLARSDERMFALSVSDSLDFESKHSNIIEYIEDNSTLMLSATPNDPLADEQWELSSLDMYNAWDVELHDREIVVAVLDSGIYRQHEDFTSVNILPGYDAVNGTVGVATDVNGHGTKVVSIIAASSDNNIGMAGICDDLTILPIRVSDSTGYVYSADFIEAVYYAADSGAKIINMSFGGYAYSAAEEAATEYAASKGCILVSASGNEGTDLNNAGKKAYPASYNNVISVGAADDSGAACTFSQYNDSVDIIAPGYNITVANDNGGYEKETGTSFAAPYVSGVIGLALMAIDEGISFSADEFVSLIADLNGNYRSDRNGYGTVNAYAVLRSINRPLFSGVIDNGVYHKNITITFNRGIAWLDGEAFKSGDTVMVSGRHTMEISDNGTVVELSFITDNIPLKYDYVEESDYSYVTFSRGTAILDGVPYLSGTKIKTEGSHYFTITGPYGNSETFEFNCDFSAPTVFGVKNGGYYTSPVHISAETEGVLTLNGTAVLSDIVISSNGTYALVAANNGKRQTIYFTVAIPGVSSYSTTVSDAKIAIDDAYNTIYLYNETLSGARAYINGNLNQASSFVRMSDGVLGHIFYDDYVAFLHDAGVTVYNRAELSGGKAASSVYYPFKAEAKAVTSSRSSVYYVLETGASSELRCLNLINGTDVVIDTLNESISYASSNDTVVMLLSSGNTVYCFDVNGGRTLNYSVAAGDYLACGHDAFTDGRYVYSLSNGEKLFSLQSNDKPIAFIEDFLITEFSIYDLQKKSRVGCFENALTDMGVSSSGYVYKCTDNFLIEALKAPEELSSSNVLLYFNAASVNTAYISSTSEASVFTESAHFPSTTNITDSAISTDGKRLFALSPQEQRLYIITAASFTIESVIQLRFVPSSICVDTNFLYVSFANDSYIFKLSIANFVESYYKCNHSYTMIKLFGTTLFALTQSGDLYSYSTNNLTQNAGVVIRSQNITDFDCSGGYIYALLRPSTISFVYKINISDNSIVNTMPIGNSNSALIATDNVIFIGGSAYLSDNLSLSFSLPDDVIYADNNYALTGTGLYFSTGGTVLGNHRFKLNSPLFDANYNCYNISGSNLLKIKNSRSDLHTLPKIRGIADGESFKGAVKPSVDFGFVYADGELIVADSQIENGGKHTLIVALPFGVFKTLTFSIEAKINSIKLSFKKNTLSVNETLNAVITARPTTYGTVEVVYTTSNENIIAYSDGTIIGVSPGECIVTATTADGLYSSSVTLTILPSTIIFDSSYFNERSDGIVDMIPPGTSIEMLFSAVSSTYGDVYVTTTDGNYVNVGVISTGMNAVLYDINGNIIDTRILAVFGDIDCDGYTTANDYYVLDGYLANVDILHPGVKASADIDGNGELNSFDLLAFKEHLLGENPIIDVNAFPSREPRAVPKISMPDYLMPGTNFSAGFILEDAQNVTSISGTIAFDSSKLTVNSATVNGVEGGYSYDTPGALHFFTDCNPKTVTEIVVTINFTVSEFVDTDGGIIITWRDIQLYDGNSAKCSSVSASSALKNELVPDIMIFNIPDYQFDVNTVEYSLSLPPQSQKVYVSAYPETLFTISGSTNFVDGVAEFFAVMNPSSNAVRYSFVCTAETTNSLEAATPESLKNDNTYLASVTVSGGVISPVFDKNVKEYFIVAKAVDKVTIEATPESVSTIVSISDLDTARGTITVTCTADNGKTDKYIFHVTKGSPIEYDFFSHSNVYKYIWSFICIVMIVIVLLLTATHFKVIIKKVNR